jgi:hypothetical protein
MTQNKTQDFMTFESKSAITSWIIKFNHLFFNESEIGAVLYSREEKARMPRIPKPTGKERL